MDWSVKPCSQSAASALADALELSETTARVLVRRGYDDPVEARAFLEGALPGHDPFLLGDMAAGVDAI
jgi:single-stranded-DNA-specific exonuclease